MPAGGRQKLSVMIDNVFYFGAPKALIVGYVAALCVAYIVVAVHIPLSILATPIADEALYVSVGKNLAAGEWLGPYADGALTKGPGYPAFLALGYWLGLSSSLAHALFHCAVVIFFVVVAHRLIGSLLISGTLFSLLLWQPISLSAWLLRLLRDQIYYGQLLIVFAALTGALFCPRTNRERLFFAILAGIALGWFWLTREEGLWVVPALALIAILAAIQAYRTSRLRSVTSVLLIFVGVFLATQVSFRAANWWAYGAFVGVEDTEANFVRTLGALQSVRSGGVKPLVSVTRAARAGIYAVSPSFASLKPWLEDGYWEKITCKYQAPSCGEIGAAWFIFALRNAAVAARHASSAGEASAFFGRIADEVSAACASDALECAPQAFGLIPPWSWRQMADRLPPLIRESANVLLMFNPPLDLNDSAGTQDSLDEFLRFSNYPLHTKSADIQPLVAYTLSGWYHRSGQDWISVAIRAPDGTPVEAHLDRNASPDIAQYFNDAQAGSQRFVIRTRCTGNCVLEVKTPDGEKGEKKLSELSSGCPVGSGTFFLDSVTRPTDPAYVPTRADRISDSVRIDVLTHYKYVLLPFLFLGVVAFLATTLLHWKKVPWNACYSLALASWLLVLLRVALLILISATSFSALNGIYMAPAYFMLVIGAAFSCAAWLQLSGYEPPAKGSEEIAP